ncbi:PREDICTED: uncharacterized protein LOC106124203 [Papilio xuthus]|uniref:Uncharacterized protein LOC106124203 n=1 Tax=Papilio xuthus TaxID=66420 RepID=A0A194PUA7_PAPXU|nr:PREDICTED: uncharacterized protein LOC106124203 [Papilio xuthus]KPI96339.1 hypothetical protein RR46_12369 [Papilio xuthus]
MEPQFEKLIKAGKNSVDGVIQWMKDAKIIDGVKVTEEKARDVFKDVSDPKNINIDTFKEGLTKLATQQQQNFEEFTKTLTTEAPRFLEALQAGASAFKNALSGK